MVRDFKKYNNLMIHQEKQMKQKIITESENRQLKLKRILDKKNK